ncbi:hypothetical protein LPTSP4_10780 [Leptospira ryugenii]|uniref:Uncharacterized protein n=1 Tax=Leptospira ryugenii TaxID=1917863 RepID=A0A2P2DY72_9LEPT|nr:hypothetical protein [Leptospira ryugenii]GBF49563.1 hypothetical protein LPTSP4_10780 [Leptospira ryugenii]
MSQNNTLQNPNFPKLIEVYQKALIFRYSEDRLQRYPQFQKIPRKTIDSLIQFFLDYLYPEYEERKRLDAAFQSLASFVHSPSKLWGILGNLASSIFQFGKHFPKALKAGISALQAYVTAHHFEEILLKATDEEAKFGDPLESEDGFQRILSRIPEKDADDFREDITSLFQIFTDQTLVEKIILIMKNVLERMKGKPQIYSEDDCQAIRLGIGILEEGKKLFESLRLEEMHLIIRAIDQIEKDFFIEAKRRV